MAFFLLAISGYMLAVCLVVLFVAAFSKAVKKEFNMMTREQIEQNFKDGVYDNKEEYVPFKVDQAANARYEARNREAHAQFMSDIKDYARSKGVPEQAISHLVWTAWDSGHSSGYSEVFGCLSSAIGDLQEMGFIEKEAR